MSAPLFSSVRSGDTILVGENEICKVLSFTGGSRDPDAPSLFQVANVDTGEIKHVHAAEVKEIVCRWEKESLNLPVEKPLSNFLPTVENYERKVNKKKLRGDEESKNWKALHHMTEPEVHPNKYFDQIEVFGSMEKRSWIHGPKSPKRFFINELKCPVRTVSYTHLTLPTKRIV